MTALDLSAQERSFLSEDAAFAFVMALHVRNRIVPVIGDFGGPAAIRAIGQYVQVARRKAVESAGQRPPR